MTSAIKRKTHLASHLVLLNAQEVHRLIEVHLSKLGLFDHPVIEFTLEIHVKMEHLIVGAPWKEDFASVQLVERASNRPHVDGFVIPEPEDCSMSGFVSVGSGACTTKPDTY